METRYRTCTCISFLGTGGTNLKVNRSIPGWYRARSTLRANSKVSAMPSLQRSVRTTHNRQCTHRKALAWKNFGIGSIAAYSAVTKPETFLRYQSRRRRALLLSRIERPNIVAFLGRGIETEGAMFVRMGASRTQILRLACLTAWGSRPRGVLRMTPQLGLRG